MRGTQIIFMSLQSSAFLKTWLPQYIYMSHSFLSWYQRCRFLPRIDLLVLDYGVVQCAPVITCDKQVALAGRVSKVLPSFCTATCVSFVFLCRLLVKKKTVSVH
ncbi:hypothetical protein GDO81_020877 [Engystomops pustulosus]|uniref:Secreted protein n=1 Tax=Engystomops pustulosus TaxID=76066 RepID=A0AAV6ZDH8_ENGPU|nr:hypothetical protein GDO81_020877 [Engystomops pustulosus]